MRTPRSNIKTMRGLSSCINQVVHRRKRFILLRGRGPVTRRQSIPTGLPLSELEATLRSLPALSAREAEAFAADIEDARAELPAAEAGDPRLPA